MFDNNKLVSQSAEHPDNIANQGDVHSATGLVGESIGQDPTMKREYHEAVMMIYKFQEEFKATAAGRSLVEEVTEGVTTSRRATAWQADLPPLSAQLPMAPAAAPPLTFSDLAERISSQLQAVMASGKQITAASRRMSDGVQELNEGVGTLKSKLNRVKY